MQRLENCISVYTIDSSNHVLKGKLLNKYDESYFLHLENDSEIWVNKDNVYFLGYTEHNKCLSIVKNSEFVIFPSIWYEGCSMVEIETESLDKALIATDLGFSQELITDGYNGYKVQLGYVSGFRDKIIELWHNPELSKKMGENARKDYEDKFMPEDNYRQLIEIYNSMMGKG